MITRKLTAHSARAKVIFTVPADGGPVSVAGDFNGWDPTANPLRKRGDARSASVELDAGRRYAFRYVDASGRWLNDEQPDSFEANGFGDDNGIVDLTTL